MKRVFGNLKLLGKTGVAITVNGIQVNVEEGSTILDAVNAVLPENERVPTICYHPYLSPNSSCEICLVETNEGLVPACDTLVSEGMSVITNSPAVNDNIRAVLKYLLQTHPLDCPTCTVNNSCHFQDYLGRYGVSPKDLDDKESYIKACKESYSNNEVVFGNNAVWLDKSKCIKCTRCVRACHEIQQQDVLKLNEDNEPMFNSASDVDALSCIGCGQCTFVCPTGALTMNQDIDTVFEWLRDPNITVVGQTAPATRVTVAEDLNLDAGDITDHQMIAGMRKIGFDYVFDTNFSADLTILEEGSELIQRVVNGGPFPMFTSCCPAWINLAEKEYPEFIENLSTCKSPQGMMGALIKNYWAPKVGVESENLRTVSIMPCTAKKDECVREQLYGDVDVVLTTRELARLFKLERINIKSLEEELYDDPLGESTGAAVIFGATGGVMEAAVRTAYEIISGEEMPDINLTPVRGLEGIKEAELDVAGIKLKVAVAHQGKNIHELMKMIKEGEEYHFVEIMACPGGCIGGGGNPKGQSCISGQEEFLERRIDAIYNLDNNYPKRKSHENRSIIKLYEEFLGMPLGHKSHELLHTTYSKQETGKK